MLVMTTQPSPSGCREQQYQIRLMHEASLLILAGHLEIKKKKTEREKGKRDRRRRKKQKRKRKREVQSIKFKQQVRVFFLSKFLLSYF